MSASNVKNRILAAYERAEEACTVNDYWELPVEERARRLTRMKTLKDALDIIRDEEA
jgi:hypothetical protein